MNEDDDFGSGLVIECNIGEHTIKQEPIDDIESNLAVENTSVKMEKHKLFIKLEETHDLEDEHITKEIFKIKDEKNDNVESEKFPICAAFELPRKNQQNYLDNPRRRKLKPGQIRSFVEDLRVQYPELRNDAQLLVNTLSVILKNQKPPLPPDDCFRSNKENFECTKCNVISESLSAAQRHYQNKHGPRGIVCYACGVDFRSKTNLYRHEKRCTAPDAELVLKARAISFDRKTQGRQYLHLRKDAPPTITDAKFPCSLCSATFTMRNSLLAHEALHRGERPFQCHVCPAAYTSASALARHVGKHTGKKFVCDHCGREFTVKASLAIHMDTHRPERKYACEICGQRYAQKSAMNLHVDRVHRNLPPPFACELCPKRFPRMSIMKLHMKKEHGLDIVTRKMFFRKLPMLSENEVKRAAKVVFKGETTPRHDEIIQQVYKEQDETETIPDTTREPEVILKIKEEVTEFINIKLEPEDVHEEDVNDEMVLSEYKNLPTCEAYPLSAIDKPVKKEPEMIQSIEIEITVNKPMKTEAIVNEQATSEEYNTNEYHGRRKLRPGEQRSTVERLRNKNPELRNDRKLLIKTLSTIMSNVKTPRISKGCCRQIGDEFKCTACGAKSISLGAAKRHYLIHVPKYVACFACGFNFRSVENLKKHEKSCTAPDAKVVRKARSLCIKNKRMHKTNAKYACTLCSAVYKNKSSLLAHEALHRGERPFQCQLCRAAYTSATALARHVGKHTGKKFVCDHCGREFTVKASLAIHMDTHRPERKYACEICGQRYAQKFAMNLHVDRMHKNLPPPCACELCPKRFNRMNLLKIHMRKEHGMEIMTRKMLFQTLPLLAKIDKRQIDELAFKTDTKIATTQSTNFTITKPTDNDRCLYACSSCSVVVEDRDSLVLHETEHGCKGPYQCNICQSVFASAHMLERHIEKHSEGTYACTYCGLQFTMKDAYNMHMESHKPERKYSCDLCNRRYEQESILKLHLDSVHKVIACQLCSLRFSETSLLIKHVKEEHGSSEKNKMPHGSSSTMTKEAAKEPMTQNIQSPLFECSLCSATFKMRESLLAHEGLHRGERPFQCQICPAAYTSRTALARHVSYHSDKKFVCDQCGREFKVKSSLVSHMDTHTPVRKYVCEVCGRRFSQRVNMNHHVDRVHRNLPPPYACELCPKRFTRMYTFKIHMQKEHGVMIMSKKMFFRNLPLFTKKQAKQVAKLILKTDKKPTNFNVQTINVEEEGNIDIEEKTKIKKENKNKAKKKEKSKSGAMEVKIETELKSTE